MPDYPEIYSFGETNFTNHVWVANGAGFEEPLSVHLMASKKISVAIMVYKITGSPNGEYVGKVDTGMFEGNINFPISHLTGSGTYKIKLANPGDVPAVELNGGEVYYKG